jgi:hypothetical protein
VSDEVRDHAVGLVRQFYPDFGPTLADEKLEERHDLKVSRETLRNWTRQSLAGLHAGWFGQVWQRKEYRMHRNIVPLGEKHTLAEALKCAFAMSAIGLGIKNEHPDTIESTNLIRAIQRTSPKAARFSVEIVYPSFGDLRDRDSSHGTRDMALRSPVAQGRQGRRIH